MAPSSSMRGLDPDEQTARAARVSQFGGPRSDSCSEPRVVCARLRCRERGVCLLPSPPLRARRIRFPLVSKRALSQSGDVHGIKQRAASAACTASSCRRWRSDAMRQSLSIEYGLVLSARVAGRAEHRPGVSRTMGRNCRLSLLLRDLDALGRNAVHRLELRCNVGHHVALDQYLLVRLVLRTRRNRLDRCRARELEREEGGARHTEPWSDSPSIRKQPSECDASIARELECACLY